MMSKVSDKKDSNKKRMITALEDSLGIVTTAAKAANISRSQHYVWLNEDEDYAKDVKSAEEMALDMAESSLHGQIKEGVPSSTIFYMKTKGKKRGYVEKQEHDHNLTNVTGIKLING
jgi:hypothetical protein